MSSFLVDIFTPSKVVIKDIPATSVRVPTMCGEITILPDHTHIIEKLDTGMVTVLSESGEEEFFLVTTGICKVFNKKITILSDVSEACSEINKERAEQALKSAKEKLQSVTSLSAEDNLKYTRKMDRAELRLKLSLIQS